MPPVTRSNELKRQLVRFVARSDAGASAHDVVKAITRSTNAPERDVQTALRIALNRGDLEVGSDLKLFRKPR